MVDYLPLDDDRQLVSCLNLLLGSGEFDDLDQICVSYHVTRGELDKILTFSGHFYRPGLNRVV